MADIKAAGRDYGYDCDSGEVKQMIRNGIIDPTKVIRLCVENGLGVAASVLTTDTLIDIQAFRKQTG